MNHDTTNLDVRGKVGWVKVSTACIFCTDGSITTGISLRSGLHNDIFEVVVEVICREDR